MKKILAVAISVMSLNVSAYDSYQDKGRVISAEPLFDEVRVNTPERRCWDERVTHQSRSHGNAAGTVLGGIVGGVIGNRFGGGRGRDAATVAGTLLGAAIASDHQRPVETSRYTTTERRCETVNHPTYKRERVGYRVHYSYNGHEYWTTTTRHPGRYVAVQVGVSAREYNYEPDEVNIDSRFNQRGNGNSGYSVDYDDDYDL